MCHYDRRMPIAGGELVWKPGMSCYLPAMGEGQHLSQTTGRRREKGAKNKANKSSCTGSHYDQVHKAPGWKARKKNMDLQSTWPQFLDSLARLWIPSSPCSRHASFFRCFSSRLQVSWSKLQQQPPPFHHGKPASSLKTAPAEGGPQTGSARPPGVRVVPRMVSAAVLWPFAVRGGMFVVFPNSLAFISPTFVERFFQSIRLRQLQRSATASSWPGQPLSGRLLRRYGPAQLHRRRFWRLLFLGRILRHHAGPLRRRLPARLRLVR